MTLSALWDEAARILDEYPDTTAWDLSFMLDWHIKGAEDFLRTYKPASPRNTSVPEADKVVMK